MQQITTKLPEDVVESLDHVAAEEYGDNRSEAVRELIMDALDDEPDERIEELQERIADLERENERLRNEKRLILEQREENTELQAYVEEEREERRRRQRKEEAPVWTRTKWWLLGAPSIEE